MHQLLTEECLQVEGGFLAALAALVAVFTLPKIINDHRVEYNQWGHALGQNAWDHFHPYDPNQPYYR